MTCVDLKRKIVEGIRDFDDKLLVLYKEKLAVEKCVLAEEMKILFHDKQLATHDALDRQEDAFKYVEVDNIQDIGTLHTI